jgi:hypothetical protein
MLVKIHDAYRMIVAVCDSDLYGKKFEEENKQIDLSGEFFKGEENSVEDVEEIMIDAMKDDAMFNLVGRESCNVAIRLGIIEEENILYVQGVPIAMSLL